MLPFIRAAARPANRPAFIVSPRLTDPTRAELTLYAADARSAKRIRKGEVLARAGDDVLLAATDPIQSGADGLTEIGGIFRGIALDPGSSSPLYRSRVPVEAAPPRAQEAVALRQLPVPVQALVPARAQWRRRQRAPRMRSRRGAASLSALLWAWVAAA